MITVYPGTVKDGVVVLEDGTRLREGLAVEVRVVEESIDRDEAFRRLESNSVNRYVGMDEILEEEKRELEARAARWLSS